MNDPQGERAAATAAANLAGRERSAAALSVGVGGTTVRSTRSSGAGVGQHPASEAGVLGVGGKKAGKVGSRKRADVRAGAAALAAQPAPTTATTAATTRASLASSQQQQQQNGEPSSHARTSGLLGASSRSIAHITQIHLLNLLRHTHDQPFPHRQVVHIRRRAVHDLDQAD
ncbi:unnamed protein product, partial [Tilletia controversa]